MVDLLWSLVVVAASWLGAIAGCAVDDWRYRRAGHVPGRCDQWGPCEHELESR